MRRSVRILNVPIAIIFPLPVRLQYNDPDALVCIAVYGTADSACIVSTKGRTKTWLSLAVPAEVAAWVLAPALSSRGSMGFDALSTSFEMESHTVERAWAFGGPRMVAAGIFARWEITRQSPARTCSREVGDDALR